MKRLAGTVCIALCACSSSSQNQQEAQADEYIVDCTGTDAGEGVTSDENLAAFINAEASNRVVTNQPCNAPELTSPASGERLSARTPRAIVFSDVSVSSACGTPIRPRTGLRQVPRQQPGYSRAIEAILARLSSDAQAHCGAITGTNYYFKILPQGGTTPIYTAMLSVAQFTPDAAKWQNAMGGRTGQTVTIVIERAKFLKGDIFDGPYAMQANFAVGP
jgi:hypothetical protein